MKTKLIFFAVLISLQVGAATVMAASSDAQRAADCSTYARNQADAGGGAAERSLRRGLVGATKGALFGAIIDGGKGAKRGAAVAGGLGLLGGAVQGSQDRDARYNYYYNSCMRGNL